MNQHQTNYIEDILRNDTSFREKARGLGRLFPTKYSDDDMRKTWELGVKNGFYKGIQFSHPESQIEELFTNATTKEHKEFYSKFLDLCGEYRVMITYHPDTGMVFQNDERFQQAKDRRKGKYPIL